MIAWTLAAVGGTLLGYALATMRLVWKLRSRDSLHIEDL